MTKTIPKNTSAGSAHSWQIKKLGEVCSVTAGQSPEGKFYNKTEDGLPFYQGKKEFTEKFIGMPTTWTTKITKEAIRNDILMSVRAPVGPINFATQKICIGRGLAGIRAGVNIDINFLFHFLKSFEDSIIGNHGAVFNSINKKQIEGIEIPLPPLPEQIRITKILDEAFEKLEIAKKNAEKNLKNAKELFESYLQGVFEDAGDDWGEGEIQNISKVINGYAFSSKDFNSLNPIKSVKITNVGVKEFIEETENYLPEKFKDELKTVQVKKGNIVIALTRTIIGAGLKVAVVPLNYDGALLNQRVAALVPHKEIIHQSYLYYYLTSNRVAEYVLARVNTLMQPNLSINDLRNLPVPLPPLTTQTQIVAKLDHLSTNTKKLEKIYQQKIDNLDELKKSLLQKAFRGEL